ncbi:iron-sulfur cluster carrier protein ApbC [Chitinimonas sp. BJB300]|uniref:iron-sulfur cluster carrier protein ApbC n=1 Tax=Chitinimonas sp. BJB300 TaxID=1559339 RepID=UPI000C118798|nr:iron-sulfur cluster carrier protein ApbC [Chitinimonas sp. BJB300]PHV10476.1 iron-sulfur cluster carrier protein ApbC [Chitinimonas sp. BJB300]TSJ87123.1 iron-sulfur cluster carrier protein ApbC [Chitinimonas sp. BJB300]
MATLNDLNSALSACIDIDTGRDFVAMKAVRDLAIEGGHVSLTIALPYPAKSRHAEIAAQVETALRAVAGVSQVSVKIETRIEAHIVQRGLTPLPGVKNVIAIASGKGGVGKSTTAVNLALALAAEGARVGILDADIYGPSQPLMLGLQGEKPESPDGKSILPMQAHGIQVMSIGFLIDAEQPMVWRGPMVTQALMQLLNDTRWDNLDYLLIDLPPGTGDIQLTLSQKVPVTGAVIVTTPQDIALLDARKGLRMFEKVGVPVIGIVENMAMHICSNCGHVEAIFGEGGGERMAEEYKVDLLGQLPLEMSIRLATDIGKPSVAAEPDGKVAAIYKAIARKVAVKIGEKAKDFSSKLPKIVIQNT